MSLRFLQNNLEYSLSQWAWAYIFSILVSAGGDSIMKSWRKFSKSSLTQPTLPFRVSLREEGWVYALFRNFHIVTHFFSLLSFTKATCTTAIFFFFWNAQVCIYRKVVRFLCKRMWTKAVWFIHLSIRRLYFLRLRCSPCTDFVEVERWGSKSYKMLMLLIFKWRM